MQQVSIPKDKILVGIRREDKSYWERRVVLIPEHAKLIMSQEPSIQFIVQPSDRRIFSDSEYQNVGCIISEDLTVCSLILGVKEIPPKKLLPHKTYMFFSHTIKAQKDNMPTLDHILENKIRLLDYEKIIDEKGARLVAFGRFAGIAGAIDYLAGLGQYLLQMGYSTPFLNISPSYKYFNLEQAYNHIKQVGNQLAIQVIPEELCPLVFAITGKGRCSLGAYEVLENLPHVVVKPEELQSICRNKSDPRHRTTVYVTYIESQHMVQHKDKKPFDKKDYYTNPQDYVPIFAEKYLPFITSIFHNMYWDQRFPRLISCDELRNLWERGDQKLIGIGDVTCDYEGSIEFLRKFTTPDDPFWVYNPLDEKTIDGISYRPGHILYQSLDFLPCELAYDASFHFSNILKDWIPNIAKSNIDDPYEKCTLLPHMKRSMITLNGKLTPDFEYIRQLRAKSEEEQPEAKESSNLTVYMKFTLTGKLFISKTINEILDICEKNKISFNVSKWIAGNENESHSVVDLLLYSVDLQGLGKSIHSIKSICASQKIKIEDAPITQDNQSESLKPKY